MRLRFESIFATFILLATTAEAHQNVVTLPLRWLRGNGVRSLNPIKAVSNWIHGEAEPARDDQKIIAALNKYPLWKVHKYNGISVNPVAMLNPASLPDKYGPPPLVVHVPQPSYTPHNEYAPPKNEYDPPSDSYGAPDETVGSAVLPAGSGTAEGDSAAALSALDNLSSFANFLPDPEGGGSGGLDLATLAKIINNLPEGSLEKVSGVLGVYNAKNNQDRFSSFLNATAATKKLKAGAVTSLSNFVQGLLQGVAGGSKNVGIESGTYNQVPAGYPNAQTGFLGSLPFLSSTSTGIALPGLPSVASLPIIPFLSKFHNQVKTPQLPQVYLPSTIPVNEHKGPYVSIKMPEPATTYGVPASTYGVPKPAPTYGVPKPAPTYGVPKPAPTYGVPKPADSYGAPLPDNVQLNLPQVEPAAFNTPGQTATYSVPTDSYGVPLTASYLIPFESSAAQAGSSSASESFQPLSFGGADQNSFYTIPASEYATPNDFLPAASEKQESIVSPQESQGYSRVVMQRGSPNGVNIPSENSQVDLSMYLDPNHPASTQKQNQENIGNQQQTGQQLQQESHYSEDIQPPPSHPSPPQPAPCDSAMC